jgi:hypothetical protein
MMSNFEFHKRILATLVLAMMALSMAVLPACSSSEESEDTSSGSGCYEGGPEWPDCKL